MKSTEGQFQSGYQPVLRLKFENALNCCYSENNRYWRCFNEHWMAAIQPVFSDRNSFDKRCMSKFFEFLLQVKRKQTPLILPIFFPCSGFLNELHIASIQPVVSKMDNLEMLKMRYFFSTGLEH